MDVDRLTNLPDELLIEIMERLPIDDVLRLCSANNKLANICEDRQFWLYRLGHDFQNIPKPKYVRDPKSHYINLFKIFRDFPRLIINYERIYDPLQYYIDLKAAFDKLTDVDIPMYYVDRDHRILISAMDVYYYVIPDIIVIPFDDDRYIFIDNSALYSGYFNFIRSLIQENNYMDIVKRMPNAQIVNKDTIFELLNNYNPVIEEINPDFARQLITLGLAKYKGVYSFEEVDVMIRENIDEILYGNNVNVLDNYLDDDVDDGDDFDDDFNDLDDDLEN